MIENIQAADPTFFAYLMQEITPEAQQEFFQTLQKAVTVAMDEKNREKAAEEKAKLKKSKMLAWEPRNFSMRCTPN